MLKKDPDLLNLELVHSKMEERAKSSGTFAWIKVYEGWHDLKKTSNTKVFFSKRKAIWIEIILVYNRLASPVLNQRFHNINEPFLRSIVQHGPLL